MRKAFVIIALALALCACERPVKTPTPKSSVVIVPTEVDTRCEEDEPCWVCSAGDDRCSSRSF